MAVKNTSILWNNKRWFYYLVPNNENISLIKAVGQDRVSSELCVCYQTKTSRLFSIFKTPDDYQKFIKRIPRNRRHFYEVVSRRKQKPHFDIDLKVAKYPDVNPVTLLIELVDAIKKVIKEEGIVLSKENILIYDSSDSHKYSYHVIVNGYCHADHVQASAFYSRVMVQLGNKYPDDIIDFNVYKVTQQFRILGSSKQGSARIKRYKPLSSYTPDDELKASLISWTYGCTDLPNFRKTILSQSERSDVQLTDNNVKSYINMMKNKFRLKNGIIPFQLRQIKDGLIILKRVQPTYCKVCQRVHDKENPFMYVSKGQLIFHCRRNQQKGIVIATLEKEERSLDDEFYQSYLELKKSSSPVDDSTDLIPDLSTIKNQTKSSIPRRPKTRISNAQAAQLLQKNDRS